MIFGKAANSKIEVWCVNVNFHVLFSCFTKERHFYCKTIDEGHFPLFFHFSPERRQSL